MTDWQNKTTEDDLFHLPEILERHDLSRDPLAGSLEQFRARSLDNFNNRCLHHHVFDEKNSRDLLTRSGFEVLAVEKGDAHPSLPAGAASVKSAFILGNDGKPFGTTFTNHAIPACG